MLDRLQKQTLQRMVKEDSWDILVYSLKEYIDRIQAEEVIGSNEFETLRTLHIKQGKISGLTEFFSKVEQGALT